MKNTIPGTSFLDSVNKKYDRIDNEMASLSILEAIERAKNDCFLAICGGGWKK